MGWTKSQIKHLLFEFVGLTLQICWMCNATKGSTNMGLCFTDLSHSALWRTTILQEFPWSVEPCYTQLVGFELSMVNCDLLHMWNLGVLRDVVGSILKVVLKETFVFDGHDIEARLRSATILLRQYAKNNGHTLRLKKLTKKILWSNKTFPEFQGSGTDCHVVATWLETILQNHLDRYGDLATLLWSGNKAMRLLYSSPNLFLSESEKRTWSCREGVSLHLHAVGCRGAWTEWNVIQMPTKIPYDGASYRKSSICQLGKIICNLVRRRLVEEGCQNHEVLCCDYGASPGVGKMAFSYPCKYPQISTSRRKVKKMGSPTGWHRRLHGHTRIGGCGQY